MRPCEPLPSGRGSDFSGGYRAATGRERSTTYATNFRLRTLESFNYLELIEGERIRRPPLHGDQDLGWFAKEDAVAAAGPIVEDLHHLKIRAGYFVDHDRLRNTMATAIGGYA